MSESDHLIFGTGPLAQGVMRALRNAGFPCGWSTARAQDLRTSQGMSRYIAGDASNLEFTRIVAAGAKIVYQCAQPPYHEWVEKFPPIQAAILEGAAANGAKLIVGENTYMYGDVGWPAPD